MKDNTEGAERRSLCRRVTDASSLLRSEVAAAGAVGEGELRSPGARAMLFISVMGRSVRESASPSQRERRKDAELWRIIVSLLESVRRTERAPLG